jgi:small-conductance mechanosensitive channel
MHEHTTTTRRGMTTKTLHVLLTCFLVAAFFRPVGAFALDTNHDTNHAADHAAPAASQSAPSQNTLTRDEARAALDTLRDDAKRKVLIDTLRAISNGQATRAPASQAKPDTPQAEGSAAQLLLDVSNAVTSFMVQAVGVIRSVTRVPQLWHWLRKSFDDPATGGLLFDIAWKLAAVFGASLAAEMLAIRLLRRPLAALETRMPFAARAPAALVERDPTAATRPSAPPDASNRQLRLVRIRQALLRVPFVIARFVLEMLPVVAFACTVTLVLGSVADRGSAPKLAILAVVNGYLIARSLVAIVRALFGPTSLFIVRGETAAYLEIWTRRIAAVGLTGLVIAHVALLMGLYRSVYLALIRLVLLVVHLLFVVVILQCRRPVAAALHAPHGATPSLLTTTRNWLAAMWYVLAIALDLSVWAVWAFDVENAPNVLLHYVAGTLLVVSGTQLVSMVTLGLIDRGFRIRPEILTRFPGIEARANRYVPMLRSVVAAIIAVAGFVALLEVWGVNAIVWFYAGQIGSRVVSAIATIGVAVLAAVAVWEGCNALIDMKLATLTRAGAWARAARLRTFQPMVRTTLLCTVVTVVALTVLTQIGVDVAPLLAGAGILGLAIGFGSQKLVQDVITGLFMLLENNVQVGDNVTLSGLSGTVENVSIRTIRLRAADGSIHILPFSAVTTITNASRGLGNVPVSVAVSTDEDTDRAGEILKGIVAEMRGDKMLAHAMLGSLELWGIDKVDGAMAVIVGQIRCTDSGRWPVQREFNRRLKIRFAQEGIAFASPNERVSILLPAPTSDRDAIDALPRRAVAAGAHR